MLRFLSVLLATIALASAFENGESPDKTCSDISELGTPNLDRFDGKFDIDVDGDCRYTWTVDFKHDESLPVPTEPSTQCDPTIVPPALADDGIPFLAFRWHYEIVPDYFEKATGINHISLDYNPCGHPPAGIFTAPHYDYHTYRVTPEFRTCMLCDLLPGTPVCDFTTDQTSDSGKAFFAPITKDLPATFVNMEGDAVPLMGGHAWDPAKEKNASEWTDPIMVMGTYDGNNLFYEPMAPLGFVTGPTDNFWEENIVYENQKTENLADYASVAYDASTGVTTATFKGKSSICKYQLEDLKNGGSGILGSIQDFIAGMFPFEV